MVGSDLARPGGTQQLWESQVTALTSARDNGGLFGDIPVGGGKTFITALMPHMFPDCRRYALLLPASLESKTVREFDELFDHWKFPAGVEYRMFSYSLLGRPEHATDLADYAPDLIVADEAHRLKDGDVGVTRRVMRYLEANPNVVFCALSGTLFGGPWEPLARLMWMAFRGKSPLPTKVSTVRRWDTLLAGFTPFYPPDLRAYGRDEESIRIGLTAHCKKHPGVVSVETDRGNAHLTLDVRRPPRPDVVASAMARLTGTNLAPGSTRLDCTDSDKARHMQTLAWGFYYRLSPEPPDSWLDARRLWARFVVETIQHSKVWDTESQVADACAAGTLKDHGLWERWACEKLSFKENRETVWLTDEVVQSLPRPGPRTLYWTRFRALGRRVSEVLGIPFLHQGSADNVEGRTGPLVLSIQSHKEGRNLQHKWDESHVLTSPGDVGIYEQLIGRTMRPGQPSEEVKVHVWIGDSRGRQRFTELLHEAKVRAKMRESANLLTIAQGQ